MKSLIAVRAGLALSALVAVGAFAQGHTGSASATVSRSQSAPSFQVAAASVRPDQVDSVHGWPC